MQVGWSYGAVAYPHSALPGRAGTIFIAGHSSPPDDRARRSGYGHLFARLPNIHEGERVLLEVAGAFAVYRVVRTHVIPATDTNILAQQEDTELLVLITCYPVGTTRERCAVVARRVE